MKQRPFALGLALLAAMALPGLADELPKGSTPMTPDEVAQMYVGKTANWTKSTAYFGADGTVKGLYKTDTSHGIFWGKWQIKGNELCNVGMQGYDATHGDPWEGKGDCWKWWTDPKGKPVILWSKHYDGTKPDTTHDYYRDEVKKLKKGDKVSRGFDKIYKQMKG